jgi:uncharacterized membrane protein
MTKNPLMKKDRLEMFSDGVFAIAITLLILEIKIPKHEAVVEAGGLYSYLKGIWPSYLAYVVSFFMIGIYWSNHHHLFNFIVKKTNHTFNLINILFLLTIAFMPFATAVFGDYILHHEYFNAAVTIYCIGIILPQPAVMILFFYGKYKRGIFDVNLSNTFLNKQLLKLLAATILTGVALALSFNYPIVSLSMIGISFLMYFLAPDMPEYKEGYIATDLEEAEF